MTTFTTQDRQDAQRTPLADEKIQEVYKRVYGDIIVPATRKTFEFARAIERAHGIGE